MKSMAQLRELDDEALFNYFTNHARYHSKAPDKKYVVLCGSSHLFSDDTADLREQFFAAVRAKGKPQ